MHDNTLPGSPACDGRRLHNGPDEERYVEGMVVINNGSRIGGINDTSEDIGFLGYLGTKLPKKNKGAHGLFQIAGRAIDRNNEIGSSS